MKVSPVIEIQNVTKKYGDYLALNKINFSIEQGDLLSIIGPNGSGKSTLAKIITGLLEPDTGQVLINGRPPKKQRHKIGYVPQHFFFDRTIPITVMEFLNLVPCPHPEHQQKNASTQALKTVGLYNLRNRNLGVLSGGELQRTLIARALLHEREILVLDEPATGIDIKGEQAVYELLEKISLNNKVTIIVITHEINFVTKYATKVLCLNQKMACYGRPQSVLTAQAMQNLFGKNFTLYKHQH